jgi:hypothetical protein
VVSQGSGGFGQTYWRASVLFFVALALQIMYGGSSFCLPKIDNGLLLATWQTKVFELLLAAGKIDQQTVDEMRTWPHSGFSVDNSVYLPAYDTAALQRLAQYILRCPFSLICGVPSAWPEGNAITGQTTPGSPNSFLCTKKLYGNFELEFEVKVHNQLNSGVQIRSQTKPVAKGKKEKFGRVNGPQVEIEASGAKGAEAGYVYGEATGRGWLTTTDRLKPHKVLKDGQWNKFRQNIRNNGGLRATRTPADHREAQVTFFVQPWRPLI